MKPKQTLFLLSTTFIFCMLLVLNGCHSVKLHETKKFNSYLKSQQDTFKKQLAEVEAQFPMVALALIMQEATIAENANRTLTASVVSLTGSTTLSKEPSVRLKICLDHLLRDLGRSQTYQEGVAAFERYNNCRNRVN